MYFHRSVLSLFLVAVSHGVLAQGGIRAIFLNYEPVVVGTQADLVHVGLGYDADLNDRLSMRVQVRTSTGISSWVVNYHSNYHFSDNESTSLYLGPNIGVRSVGDEQRKTLIPLGLRMGARGGLQGFYGDLYVGAHYNIGGGGRVPVSEGQGPNELHSLTFCAGLDIGFGWGKKKKW